MNLKGGDMNAVQGDKKEHKCWQHSCSKEIRYPVKSQRHYTV